MSEFYSGMRLTIERFGYHITLVTPGPSPRFIYTTGLSEQVGIELVLAGASVYDAQTADRIVRESVPVLGRGERESVVLSDVGTFSLRLVDASWTERMLLAANRHAGVPAVAALQLVPPVVDLTVDVPDMSMPWTPAGSGPWRWIREAWSLPVPESSVVTTNLAALRGAPVTEVVRWEFDHWEAFAGAGPDVVAEDARVVPFGTLLGADSSLTPAISLEVGKGLWRSGRVEEWQEWG